MSPAQRRAMFAHMREHNGQNRPRSAYVPPRDLQPHQLRVVRRILQPETTGLVVAHGLGSGKTRTAIESHKALGGEADVVLPAALKENYLKELKKWHGRVNSTNILSQQIVALRRHTLGSPLLVVDEGHRARNPKTYIAEAIKKSTASKRLILSGTPIYNSAADIATLVNHAAAADVLPEGSAFTKRHLRPSFLAAASGSRLSNVKSLRAALDRYVDYHPGDPTLLPTVKETVVTVPMGPKQSELYRASIGKIPRHLRFVASNIERLKPYLTGPRMVSNTSNALLKGTNEEPKIERAFADLKEHLANPRGKALVYSNWLEHGVAPLERRMREAGIKHGTFTGRESAVVRNQAVHDYNAGKLRALLVSSSGGEGLDLKGTRLVQLLEPHFNNAKIRQVIGRSARIGSHTKLSPEERTVEARLYIARPQNRWLPGTGKGVDELLRESAQEKDEVERQVIGLLKRPQSQVS